MRRILSLMAVGLALWGMAFAYGAMALAQSVPPVPHDVPSGLGDLTFGQVMVLISNFGIGGLVFLVWWYDQRRQTGLEQLNQRYDESSEQHLIAFRDINAAYRELANKTTETMLLTVQIQTRLTEKLERMERDQEREKGRTA